MILLAVCALTVLIETLFFLALGRRGKGFLLLCAAVNTATNLTLNLLLMQISRAGLCPLLWIYPLEAAVVLAEFLILSAYEKGGVRLLCQVFLANAISYGVGVLLLGHV